MVQLIFFFPREKQLVILTSSQIIKEKTHLATYLETISKPRHRKMDLLLFCDCEGKHIQNM